MGYTITRKVARQKPLRSTSVGRSWWSSFWAEICVFIKDSDSLYMTNLAQNLQTLHNSFEISKWHFLIIQISRRTRCWVLWDTVWSCFVLLWLCNELFMMTSSMDTFSALLAFCVGISPVTGQFSSQRPVTRSLDVFFDLLYNKRLGKQSWGWWFETPARSLWRHSDYIIPGYEIVRFAGVWSCVHDHTCWSWEEK